MAQDMVYFGMCSIGTWLKKMCILWYYIRASLVAQMVKHLSTMQETRVWSMGQEDPLEKEMVIHSSTIAWIHEMFCKCRSYPIG